MEVIKFLLAIPVALLIANVAVLIGFVIYWLFPLLIVAIAWLLIYANAACTCFRHRRREAPSRRWPGIRGRMKAKWAARELSPPSFLTAAFAKYRRSTRESADRGLTQ